MTELETRLTEELKIQREMFKEALEESTKQHERFVKSLANDYIAKMNEALKIIERQAETIEMQRNTLERYKSAAESLENFDIDIDQEPIERLNERLTQLESSQAQLAELLRRL